MVSYQLSEYQISNDYSEETTKLHILKHKLHNTMQALKFRQNKIYSQVLIVIFVQQKENRTVQYINCRTVIPLLLRNLAQA